MPKITIKPTLELTIDRNWIKDTYDRDTGTFDTAKLAAWIEQQLPAPLQAAIEAVATEMIDTAICIGKSADWLTPAAAAA